MQAGARLFQTGVKSRITTRSGCGSEVSVGIHKCTQPWFFDRGQASCRQTTKRLENLNWLVWKSWHAIGNPAVCSITPEMFFWISLNILRHGQNILCKIFLSMTVLFWSQFFHSICGNEFQFVQILMAIDWANLVVPVYCPVCHKWTQHFAPHFNFLFHSHFLTFGFPLNHCIAHQKNALECFTGFTVNLCSSDLSDCPPLFPKLAKWHPFVKALAGTRSQL